MAPLPFEVGKEVLQIVHEALNNVRKHAGISSAQVVVLQQEVALHVLVADSGAGFALAEGDGKAASEQGEGHFGLQIMADRAAAIDASLKITSKPGAGTQVLLRVPLSDVQLPQAQPDVAWSKRLLSLRVLLADDHPLFVEGLSNMLAARGVQVVGRAANGLEAQEMARILRPEVILMDIHMPHCDGVTAISAIKAELPGTKIIVLTVGAEHDKLFQALRAGASGYLLKSLHSDTFFALLADALRGEIVLSQGLAQQALNELTPFLHSAQLPLAIEPPAATLSNPLLNLSPRQRDILERTAQGSTYKEIAAALFISESTVKYHMGQTIELLQVANRRQAIALVRQSH